MNSAREKLAGLHVPETAQWHQGQEPLPPYFAHSAEAGLQTKVLSVINRGEICSAAVSEPGSDKHGTASFPVLWGDEWLELEVLLGDSWQEFGFLPHSQYSVFCFACFLASSDHSCS